MGWNDESSNARSTDKNRVRYCVRERTMPQDKQGTDADINVDISDTLISVHCKYSEASKKASKLQQTGRNVYVSIFTDKDE